MPTDWTEKVRNAITNLETKIGRVLEPGQALAIIDDVVEGKLAAYELAIIHGIPEAWIEVTLGHVTRTVQGTGRALPLDAGSAASTMTSPMKKSFRGPSSAVVPWRWAFVRRSGSRCSSTASASAP